MLLQSWAFKMLTSQMHVITLIFNFILLLLNKQKGEGIEGIENSEE